MDLHYKQEVTVGALVVAGVALFVAGTMWLSGRSLTPGGGKVQVQFTNVSTLKRGNPVKVSGVTLGSVEEIRFRGFGDVLVTLTLTREIVPKVDATASLQAVGLVGDLQVNFNPGTEATLLPMDRIIVGTQERGLTQLGEDLGGQAQAVMTSLQDVVNKRLADDLHATLTTLQRMMDVYSDKRTGPTAELSATMVSLQRLSNRMDSTLASPALDRVLGNMDTLTARLSAVTEQFTTTGARLDTLLLRVDRGEGTLGKFATDSTLYTEMVATSRSLRKLLDELTRYPGKITVQLKIF